MPRTLKRRRKEAKTDYRLRLGLLRSGKARLVVRKTNKYIVAQIIESETAQDKIVTGVSSKDLIAKGWPEKLSGSLKSIPAAYLTGFLIGSKAKVKEAILDIGMHRNVSKSRLYAFLKGAIDSGLKVPHDKDVLPEIKPQEGLDLNKLKGQIQNG